MEKIPNLIVALDAGIGVAIISGYLLFKLKKIKKRLKQTVLRRLS